MAQYSLWFHLGGWSDYCRGISGTVSVRLPNDGHCLSVDFAGAGNLRPAPVIIDLSFLVATQLCLVGIVGEYIGSFHTPVLNTPMVIEKERTNFD